MNRIDDFLTRSRESLYNCQNDTDLSDVLANFGYDATALAEGQALYDNAKRLDEEQDAEIGDQREAYQDYKAKRNEIDQLYRNHLRIARVAFKREADANTELQLSGIRKRRFSSWEKQTTAFYNGIAGKQEYQDLMVRFIPVQQLLDTRDLLNQTLSLYATFRQEQSEAEAKTIERDEALDILAEWFSDFYNIAKVAFYDDSQQLEKLGFKR